MSFWPKKYIVPVVNNVKSEPGTDVVIQAHQQITLNIFTHFRSDSRRPLHWSARIESPHLCQTHLIPKCTRWYYQNLMYHCKNPGSSQMREKCGLA